MPDATRSRRSYPVRVAFLNSFIPCIALNKQPDLRSNICFLRHHNKKGPSMNEGQKPTSTRRLELKCWERIEDFGQSEGRQGQLKDGTKKKADT